MEQYSIFDAANILGKDHTAIREWLKRDFIPIENWQKAKGRGTKTILTVYDLYRIRAFQVFLDAGIGRSYASKMVQKMKESGENIWENQFAIFGKTPGEAVMVAVWATEPISLFDRELPVEDGNSPPGKKAKMKINTLQLQITVSLNIIKKEIDSLIS